MRPQFLGPAALKPQRADLTLPDCDVGRGPIPCIPCPAHLPPPVSAPLCRCVGDSAQSPSPREIHVVWGQAFAAGVSFAAHPTWTSQLEGRPLGGGLELECSAMELYGTSGDICDMCEMPAPSPICDGCPADMHRRHWCSDSLLGAVVTLVEKQSVHSYSGM